jgi:hypothetical protein
MLGKTEIREATILALGLNQERSVKIRLAEQMFGLFPPQLD